MNINHEYRHLRENDSDGESRGGPADAARIDIEFLLARSVINCSRRGERWDRTGESSAS
jgi:hypothetical protein